MKIHNTALAAALLSAVVIIAPAQAQVAGLGATSKLEVILGTKAFNAGYETVQTQSTDKLNRLRALQTEIQTLSKPLDSNGDNRLTEADTAYVTAANQNDALIKSLDVNKDNTLTGSEVDQYRARNLPIAQLGAKQREAQSIEREIRVAQLFVVNAIDQKYGAALQSVVTAKKINAVLAPAAFEWAPPAINITPLVIAEIDRTLPSVALPPPANFNASRDAVAIHEQIEQLIAERIAAARAQQAQAGQPPAAQPGRPAPTTPAPTNPAPQPDSR